MSITPQEAGRLAAWAAKLWPPNSITVEIVLVIAEEIHREYLDTPTCERILKECRIENGGYYFPAALLRTKINAVSKAYYQRMVEEKQREQRDAQEADPNRRSFAGWMKWYAEDPQGKREWEVLPANVRRGLRMAIKLTADEARMKGNK